MYVNKCIKCGVEFETKNPKRVICPNCLYPDKNMMPSGGDSDQHQEHQHQEQQDNQNNQEQQNYSSENGSYSSGSYSAGGYSAGGYSAGGYSAGGYDRPQRNYDRNQGGYQPRGGYQQRGGYDRNQGGYQQRGGYDRNQGGYQQRSGYDRNQGGYQQRGGYDRNQGGYQQRGGYDRNQGGYQQRSQGGYQQRRPQGGGFQQRRPQGGFQQRRPMGGARPPKPQKQLLINKEQLEQIEALYKAMLPLPNPDAHEVIGEKIGLEPRKVFFGINLVRQKMMLPKLPFPKRKLAISPDQLMAIRSLYEPLLPLPPIGCHKIIAVQLKMDEWRVHVGIGLIRAQMGLDRWNPDREDAPEEFKNQKKDAEVAEEKPKKTRAKKAKAEEVEAETEVEEKPKKTTRAKKIAEVEEDSAEEEKPEKKTRGRKPKKVEDAE